MIREWRISRFKSIATTERLEFRPLTLLAGPNSSGKSSVIQSVLLIAQSLASQVPERHLVLNGEFIKLGTFDDVLNQQSSERTISFGFTVDLDMEQPAYLAQGPRSRLWPTTIYRPFGPEVPAMTVAGDIAFSPGLEPTDEATSRPLQADVLEASFRSSIHNRQAALFPIETEVPGEPDVVIRRRTDSEIDQLLATMPVRSSVSDSTAIQQALRYSITFSSRARKSVNQRRIELPLPEAAGELIAARLHHFLPDGVMWKQREIARTLLTAFRRFGLGAAVADLNATLDAWAQSRDSFRVALAKSLREVAEHNDTTVQKMLRELRRADPNVELVRSILQRAEHEIDSNSQKAVAFVPGPLPEEQDIAFQGLHAFFSNVRYLGPLRDDPKPVYAMSGAVDPTDVGSKGQYTAAVLDVNGSLQIHFLPPNGKLEVRRSLRDAVREWLSHFGMAESVQTKDEGKLGHRLLIRPPGIRSDIDLTNVGVGVSQVLPIVVMALIADKGTVLLFEQPELHLHPAVQSQLADFFVAMARSGRQCVVETHSEFLVNRLRLRIAESDTTDLQQMTIVHFVERAKSSTTFTPVYINDFGAIPSWPLGFFDQGPNESEQILRAAMAKKKRTKTNPADING